MRRLALLLSLLLGVSTLTALSIPAAQAAPTYPDVTDVSFTPAETDFNDQSAQLTAVVTVDAPTDWVFNHGDLALQTPGGAALPAWLTFQSENRNGQTDTITFSGQVPNQWGGLNRGYFRVFPQILYTHSGGDYLASDNGWWYHVLNGDTKATLDGTTSGSALKLTGSVTCFRNSYQPPDQGGWVDIYYTDPGGGSPTYAGGESVGGDGTWSHTVLGGGDATLDWYVIASAYPDCATDKSPVLSINGGSGPPPPPPTLPGAPSLNVGGTTQHTVSLSWGPPSGDTSKITGYRFGWTSDSGLPQPSWDKVYDNPENPFVMTNLCAGCTYHMWIEAVTNNGSGDRTTVTVTTDSPPAPPPPKPVHKPSRPRSLHARPGNHLAKLTWRAPAHSGGATVTRYQVHRNGHNYTVRARHLTVRHLLNNRTYTFTVRAHNAVGWSSWSSPARVRPHR